MIQFSVIGICVLMLFGCGIGDVWRTCLLQEALPAILDEHTMLPLVDCVTVTRTAHGDTVVLEGADAETFMLGFENILCKREKGGEVEGDYVIDFLLTDGTSVAPPLLVGKTENSKTDSFFIDGYIYTAVHESVDIAFIEGLYDETNAALLCVHGYLLFNLHNFSPRIFLSNIEP